MTPAETPRARRQSEPYIEVDVGGVPQRELDCDGEGELEGHDDLEAGTQIGEYVIHGVLGRGGMGTVYSARHPQQRRRYAIKVLARDVARLPGATERFLQEAACASRIAHQGVVKVYSWGMLPDCRLYFVMEELNGLTLARCIDDSTLELGDKLEVLAQLCDILTAAHSRGVIHRDLKPDNVQLLQTSDGRMRVKLMDFGLAKVKATTPIKRLTAIGVTLGTPEYVSPEQARGSDVDHRSDIYSLGVLAWELVLGVLPFQADSAVEVLAMHVRQEPTAPEQVWPDIPAALASTLKALLQKHPADRPRLHDVSADMRTLAATATPSVRFGKQLRPALAARAAQARAAAQVAARTRATVPTAALGMALGSQPGPAPEPDAIPQTIATVDPDTTVPQRGPRHRGRAFALAALLTVGAFLGFLHRDTAARAASAAISSAGRVVIHTADTPPALRDKGD